MSDAAPAAAVPTEPAKPGRVSVTDIFGVFLTIGATSFGGGVVAYLRRSLVKQKAWLDDVGFLELMSISSALPGLNSTNMSILVGQRLGGVAGAVAAMIGMCLPAFIFMTIAGILYTVPRDRHLVDAALRGVAAAAVGLNMATWFQIGKKNVKGFNEAFFIVLAIIGVNHFKLSVLVVLAALSVLAIYVYRPRTKPTETEAREEDEKWQSSLQ
jgi:chromate transporter